MLKNKINKFKKSLKPVSLRLSELLNKEVLFIPETRGNLVDEAVNQMKEIIKQKEADLKNKAISLGTTPRRITDLVGSLSDLVSGSGDKGTPIVLITGYFDNYADE